MAWQDWLKILSIALGTIILERTLRYVIRRSLRRATKILRVDPLNYQFTGALVTGSIYFVGIILIIYTFPTLRTFSITLFAGAGVLAAVLGFASQQALANVIGGIFIVIFKPFKVHNVIQVGSEEPGHVIDINLRHTVIRTFQNTHVIIPNSTVSSNTILNFSFGDHRVCRHVEVAVSFDSDIERAMKIMQEECLQHKLNIEWRTQEDLDNGEQRAEVQVVRMIESGMIIRLWAWAATPDDAFHLEWDLYRILNKRFRKEGIEIPYPHTTLTWKGSRNGGMGPFDQTQAAGFKLPPK
jgi:small-conductance mechanosensitive channel